MVNFGYPYNDLVICKDSTDYLHYAYKIIIIIIVIVADIDDTEVMDSFIKTRR